MKFFAEKFEYFKKVFAYIATVEFFKKLPNIIAEKKNKSIYEMSTDEFYDYLTKKPDQEEQAITFFRFMLDYLLTAYLDGQLTSEDLDNILKMENPYEMNRYIDRAVRSAKMQGTLLEELAKYQESGEKADDLYELVLPDYAYDKKEKELKINNLDDLKNAVKGSMTNLAEQKRLLDLAKMQKAEQERLENMRREILARTPEVAELISSDGYTSAEKDEVYVSNVIEKEVDQLKKKTVVRQAKVNEGLVRNKTEAEMSPSELIAYKKKMLKKLREDMHNRGGLSTRG
jgi:hypothetical protein